MILQLGSLHWFFFIFSDSNTTLLFLHNRDSWITVLWIIFGSCLYLWTHFVSPPLHMRAHQTKRQRIKLAEFSSDESWVCVYLAFCLRLLCLSRDHPTTTHAEVKVESPCLFGCCIIVPVRKWESTAAPAGCRVLRLASAKGTGARRTATSKCPAI